MSKKTSKIVSIVFIIILAVIAIKSFVEGNVAEGAVQTILCIVLGLRAYNYIKK